jgi:hypothetical protein
VAQSRHTTTLRRAAEATFGSSVLLMMFSTVCCGCSSRLYPGHPLAVRWNSRCNWSGSPCQALVARDAAADRATAPSARDGPGAPGYLPPAAAVWDSWGRARSYGTLLLRGNCCWRRRVGGGRSHSRVHHLRSIQVSARVDRRSKPRQCWARTSPLGPGHESPSAVDRTFVSERRRSRPERMLLWRDSSRLSSSRLSKESSIRSAGNRSERCARDQGHPAGASRYSLKRPASSEPPVALPAL